MGQKSALEVILARLKISRDGLCNCKEPSVFAFFECNDEAGGGDGPSGRGGIFGTSHQKLSLVKFDEKIDQKNQQ
jgi:hypothetical protein